MCPSLATTQCGQQRRDQRRSYLRKAAHSILPITLPVGNALAGWQLTTRRAARSGFISPFQTVGPTLVGMLSRTAPLAWAVPGALLHRRRALRYARCDSIADASPHWRHAHNVTKVRRLWGPPYRRCALRHDQCNSATGASPDRRHAHCVTGARRLQVVATPAMRPPLPPTLRRRPTGDAPSATVGATAPRGRRPTGGTPTAQPVCADSGAFRRRQCALRHDRGDSVRGCRPIGDTSTFRLRASHPGCRPSAVPPSATRGASALWGNRPRSRMSFPRARRVPYPGCHPSGDTPSVTTGTTASQGRHPTAATPAARPARAGHGVQPLGRLALRHAPGVCRPQGLAAPATRPPSAAGEVALRAFLPMSGQRHIGLTLQKRVSNSPLASSRGG